LRLVEKEAPPERGELGYGPEGQSEGYRIRQRRSLRVGRPWPNLASTGAVARERGRPAAFTLDGEAVVSGNDGIAVFDRLHCRQKVTDAMLYAFDLLELNGEDLRSLPLLDRAKLARLLVRSRSGIVFNDHTDDDGAAVFQHACKMGLEGIVSKD
jgi:bifunctional non-homologous end joining protein LigD